MSKAFGVYADKHLQRSVDLNRARKKERLDQLVSVLTDQWLTLPEIVEKLKRDRGLILAKNTIEQYIRKGDLNDYPIENNGTKSLRLKNQ